MQNQLWCKTPPSFWSSLHQVFQQVFQARTAFLSPPFFISSPQRLSKWPKWEIRKVGIFSLPPGLTSSSHTLPAHAGHQSALWPWGLLTYPKKFQQILEQRWEENEMPCLDGKSLRLAREGCKIPFEMLQIFSLLLLTSVTFLFQPPPPNRFTQHLYKLKCDL